MERWASMIITVTLNPAIDQTLVLPRFVAGDTLRIKASRFDPGGKGVNVSRVIHELGGKSLAMGFAPGGLGRYIEQTLQAQGIHCDFVHTKGETRTNITILDETRHLHTILSDPGPETDVRFVGRFMDRLRRHLRTDDWLVVAGSIPPPLDPSIYHDIISLGQEMETHTVLDADGAALAAGVSALPEMVKANRRELERLVGSHLDDEESTAVAAAQVQAMGVSTVVVTRGREGAVALGDGDCWRSLAPRVKAISAVGSGDDFLGGVIFDLERGGSLEESLRWGVAAGSAAVLNPGTELCHREDVEGLLRRVRVQKIEARAALV
ncbi:MAG: 1-phosphofructokinase family hexose kinase [Chloroflexi bacterium]|nr:1-phosphofructokinase family hexose kinase [Chloroflexota bacterium]